MQWNQTSNFSSISPSNKLIGRASCSNSYKSFKKKRKCDDIKTQLARFLYHYRSTLQASTGVTPVELLMGRPPQRTHLELLKADLAGKV